MARTRAAEHGAGGNGLGGAAHAAPPAGPLRLVQAAVAGDGLHDVTRQAAEACGRTVVTCLPAFGAPVHWSAGGATGAAGAIGTAGAEGAEGAHPAVLAQLRDYASALAADRPAALPDAVVDVVPVRVGQSVVGVVAALGPGPADVPVHPWLDAAAAAAAITTLIRDSGAQDGAGARRGFLEGLELNPPADIAGLLARGRRLGLDLTHGAVGVCAVGGDGAAVSAELGAGVAGALVADVGAGRVLGLVPLTLDGAEGLALELVTALRASGAAAAGSAPRRLPEGLQDALLEAAVLAELDLTPPGDGPDLGASQEETFRLLVGVLLRAPEELARLRALTVAELERYDALHDTELIGTLQAFLAHHGSTTETADAMGLHRHTVGYRLARVQEVAGLSPYESDGRERLSLGLKADRILAAESRRVARTRPV